MAWQLSTKYLIKILRYGEKTRENYLYSIELEFHKYLVKSRM